MTASPTNQSTPPPTATEQPQPVRESARFNLGCDGAICLTIFTKAQGHMAVVCEPGLPGLVLKWDDDRVENATLSKIEAWLRHAAEVRRYDRR